MEGEQPPTASEQETERARVHRAPAGERRDVIGELSQRALFVPDKVNEIELGGRAVFWVALFLLSWSVVLTPLERTQIAPTFVHLILSRVNLVFHEAGHIIFQVLGQFMATLGGSLLQVLVPLICLVTFLTRHLNPFGASVTLWWMGHSLIDLAPYINDARAQQMILLGGVTGRDVTWIPRLEQHPGVARPTRLGPYIGSLRPSVWLCFHRALGDLGRLPALASVPGCQGVTAEPAYDGPASLLRGRSCCSPQTNPLVFCPCQDPRHSSSVSFR